MRPADRARSDEQLARAGEANMRYWYLRRALAGGGEVRRNAGVIWACASGDRADGSRAIVPLPRFAPAEAACAMTPMLDYFRTRHATPRCMIGRASTPDHVRPALKAMGFQYAFFPWVCMAADLGRSPPAGPAPDVEIRLAAAGDDVTVDMHPSFGPIDQDAGRLMLAGTIAQSLRRDGRVRLLHAWRDGRLVGSATLHASRSVAGIYDLAVLPQARRDGIGTALVREALRQGRQLGHRAAVLQTDPAMIPFYASFGFRVVSAIERWEYPETAVDAPSGGSDVAIEDLVTAMITGTADEFRQRLALAPDLARARMAAGITPLHAAAWHGVSDAIGPLATAGGDPDAHEARFGGTPMTWALVALGGNGPLFKRDQLGAVLALLAAGAGFDDAQHAACAQLAPALRDRIFAAAAERR